MLSNKFILLTLFMSCLSVCFAQPPITNSQVFTNWNKQIQMVPQAVFEPSTLAELQSIIQTAKAHNIEVKATGASHSFSEIFNTNGFLIRTFNLNQTSVYSSAHHQVQVQTGTIISDLDNFLQLNGWVLPVGTVLDDITIGGSVSAGCHGTSKTYGTVADAITQIRIVDSNGDLQVYSGLTLNFAKLNLGLLGIVYDMILQVQPTYNVVMSAVTVPYNSIVNGPALQQAYQSNDTLEIYYFPFAPNVQVRTSYTTTAASTFNYTLYVDSSLMTDAEGQLLSPIIQQYPTQLYEIGSSGLFQIFNDLVDVRPKRYAVHYAYDIWLGPPFYNPEYAFCFNNDQWGQAANLINATVNLIWQYYNLTGDVHLAPCTYGLNIRFGTPSSALLSPANCNTQNVMWVDLLLGINSVGVDQFSSDVYNLYTNSPYYASPHLAKNWNNIPDTQNVKFASFLATRRFLGVDENDIFMNDALFRQFNNKFSILV